LKTSLEIKWKRKLYWNPANESFTVYLPKELAMPLKEKGIEELEIWYDPKEKVIKMKPVEA